MEPMISIIIPVYNAKRYFRKCMDSVLAQTYPNYEVILVDDGSTDGSEKMCDDYARKSGRVRVLHQKNQGAAAARNNGVNISKGEYVAFVDSDDNVAIEYLSYMYNLMQKYDADMAVAGIKVLNEEEQITNWKKDGREECLTNESALIKCCYGDGICSGPYAKLYHQKTIKMFPNPSVQIGEDFATLYHVIGNCKKIAVGDNAIYCYIIHKESVLHGEIDEKKLDGVIEVFTEFLEYVNANFPEVRQAAQIRCARAAMQCISMIVNTSGDTRSYYKKVRALLKPHIVAVWKDDFVSIWYKFRCILIMTGYCSCKLLWPAIDMMSYMRKKVRDLLTEKGFKT